MRVIAISLAFCSIALAQAGEVKDGKLTEKPWNLTYEARGLERGIATEDPTMIFAGRAAGGVQIEIIVAEGAEKAGGKEWMERFLERAKKRKLKDVEKSSDGLAWVMFTETKLDVFTEQHGYSFNPRGSQCFIVHAYVPDKTDKSGDRIKEVLKGLQLGDDPGASVLALRIASQSGLPMDDPQVLLQAGIMYANPPQGRGKPNYPMAAKILSKARKAMKEDTYNPEQLWFLYEIGGISHLSPPLRDMKTAIEWHSKAEEAAKKLPEEGGRAKRQAQSAYNLACAYSLAGEVEKGFDALNRSFSELMSVDKAHLTSDKDLDNLKKNQELWDKFWKEKVEGR